MDALASPDAGEQFMGAFQAAMQEAVIPDPARRSKEHYEGIQTVWDYVDTRIDEAVRRTAQSRDEPLSSKKQVRIIDELVKASDDKRTLRFLIISLFMPSHENLAIVVTNVFFHLARNQEIWGKLRAEVTAKANRPLTHELLTSLKYLNWIIRESKITKSKRKCLELT